MNFDLQEKLKRAELWSGHVLLCVYNILEEKGERAGGNMINGSTLVENISMIELEKKQIWHSVQGQND